MPKINVTTNKLITKVRKGPYKPIIFDLESKKQLSPAFTNPLKYSAKHKVKCNTNRIQSYQPLERSLFAKILSSPLRMSHQTRIVVPRDLMIPMKIFESSHFGKNTGSFSHYLLPVQTGNKIDERDPACYYPRNSNLFHSSENDGISPIKKFMVNLTPYKDIAKINSVGWPNVNESVLANNFENDLNEKWNSIKEVDVDLVEEQNQYQAHVVFIDNNDKPTFEIQNGLLTLNISRIPFSLKTELQNQKIQINEITIPFLSTLLQSCIHYSH